MELLILSLALLLSPIFSQTNNPDSYEKFLTDARAKFVADATRLAEEYQLGSYSWHLDQGTGKLTFSKDGVTKVVADAQIVGSTRPTRTLGCGRGPISTLMRE